MVMFSNIIGPDLDTVCEIMNAPKKAIREFKNNYVSDRRQFAPRRMAMLWENKGTTTLPTKDGKAFRLPPLWQQAQEFWLQRSAGEATQAGHAAEKPPKNHIGAVQ